MKILASHPGRSGDIIWAMPTVRALAESSGFPVDLVLSEKYGGLKELLERQDYLGEIKVLKEWQVEESAPISPRIPPISVEEASRYDQVIHLGYKGWPEVSLAHDVYGRVVEDYEVRSRWLPILDLARPWIAKPYDLKAHDLAVGFTDEWFELKYGIYHLLRKHPWSIVNLSTSPRWNAEGDGGGWDWISAAAWLGSASLFVGCCSALHVLAVAMGKPCVLLEPQKDRHQDLFYPLGKAGQVQLLLGGDGLPTHDARHLSDAIEAKLKDLVLA